LKVAREISTGGQAKADGLVAKARANGETTTEQEFADLAKGNSEDPATAKSGGWLNGIVKKNPNSPTILISACSTCNWRSHRCHQYKNAYYILRRGDSVPKTFEDAKPS